MADQPLILDYANPSRRSALHSRPPSVLKLSIDAREISVVETMLEKRGTIVGLIIAALVLALLGRGVVDEVMYAVRQAREQFEAVILLAIWISGHVMLFPVINATWRRTRIAVRDGVFTLEIFSPLRGTKRYAWPACEIADLRVEPTRDEPATPQQGWGSNRNRALGKPVGPLGQLEVHRKGEQTIVPFRNHSAQKLTRVAATLKAALAVQAMQYFDALASRELS